MNNKKLTIDIFWNFGSLFVLGISGILLNTIISIFYNSSTLGSFNQVFATYIIFSVVGSGGINNSVLQSIANHIENKSVLRSILAGALISSASISLFITLIYSLSIGLIADLLGSLAVKEGMQAAKFGVFFFSINKVLLLGVINGLQKMKEFALLQSTRYLLLIVGLILAILFSIDGNLLPFIFSFSELILFFILILRVSLYIHWWRADNILHWILRHIYFGIRCFSSVMLLELNSKIDILIIGLYLSDKYVGIYSFASLFAEGFLQLLVVLQNNYNPLIAKLISSENKKELIILIRKSQKYIYPYATLLALISSFLYLPFLNILTQQVSYNKSLLPFIILIFGMAFTSGHYTFNNIFSMSNKPFLQSIYILIVVLFNIILNLILIPPYGINGAALATSLSFIFSRFLLDSMMSNFLKIKIQS